MLINGNWTNEENKVENGVYVRAPSIYKDPISDEILKEIVTNPGRFILFSSYSCAWSHRAMLAIVFKDLEGIIPIHTIGGKRIQGYPMNNNKEFNLPNTDLFITYLHQLYTMSEKKYTGRVTVPVLWDSENHKIICNESTTLVRAFNDIGSNIIDLCPNFLSSEIENWNKEIYENLSNAVYEVGFSTCEEEKIKNVNKIDDFLKKLENHLSKNKYIVTEKLTETDLYAFTSLIRFDTCYYTIFKCSSRRLITYKNIMRYTKMIYQEQGVSQTIDFDLMYKMSVENDAKVSTEVLPKPDIDWNAP